MNLYDLEHRNAKRDALFRAADTRGTDADRPHIRNFIEVTGRTARMRVRAFTAHFIQAPALAMSLITELLDEPPGIKVGSPGAMLVNVTIVRKFRSLFLVQLRQSAIRGEL